ncbi:MFS transporter [Geitlerinema sp. PCC 9228]|uniref:MFS transporter n=1 Tax=Geitlerinema sp. PCC 9228 TaxID=111611 RepID=UPI0008F9D545|nr:MFS transporter [Geitlerinema sp. PCC 9228]
MNDNKPESNQPTQPEPQHHSWIVANAPIYYGWIVLIAGTLGTIMTTPGQTVGVSVFVDRIIGDLEISRSQMSLTYAFGTLGGSFILPFVGRFIDRYGPRLAVILISILFAIACAGMGFIGGLLSLTVGFILIRSLGQGSLTLVSLHVINLWFIRRRGMAVGLSSIGFAVGIALFPGWLENLIEAFGWRQTYIILGGIVATTILPVGALFFRGHPELFGLQPDSKHTSNISEADRPKEINYTASQARRSLTFWVFTLGDVFVSALATGLIFHHYDIMQQMGGLENQVAVAVFAPLGVVTAVTNLLTGFFIDRVEPRFLLSVMLLFLCVSLVLPIFVSNLIWMWIYGTIAGIIQGMKGVIQGSVYAHYFGRSQLGEIKGFATTLAVASTAFGPYLFALGFDIFGSYAQIFLLSMLPPLILAVAVPWLSPYTRGGEVR